MKKIFLGAAIISLAAFLQSCNDNESRYLNLKTGEPVALKEDEKTGLMVDAETGKPVEMYVDTKTRDTVWGSKGKVVNGRIKRKKAGDGNYVYVYMDDENNAVKYDKERDGDVEYKKGDYKMKNEDGEYKVKRGDYKKEVEKDGDVIIKDGNKKIKIDGKTGERKVKYDD